MELGLWGRRRDDGDAGGGFMQEDWEYSLLIGRYFGGSDKGILSVGILEACQLDAISGCGFENVELPPTTRDLLNI